MTTLRPEHMTPDAAEALDSAGFTRRGFLGALIVGFASVGTAPKASAQATPAPVIPLNQVDSWVAIGEDNMVTAYSGKCEFGQGFRTVQIQLVAEELDVPIARVKLIICDTNITPDQGTTSGSQSHPTEFGPNGLRQGLATAREALFRMASERFNMPMDQLTVEDGMISVKSDPSRRVSYGQLVAGRKFQLAVNARAVPKDPHDYRVLGTSVPRDDIPLKLTGRFEYVQNIRIPGMLHGKVVRPAVQGAKLVRVDESSVQGMPGNVRVVVKNDFVGVVADTEWQALKAAAMLDVTWSDVTLPVHDDLFTWMKSQPTRDALTVLSGDVPAELGKAARTFSATYYHPYQVHGSLGTSCAVADVKGNESATIYSSTQGVYPQRDSVARVLDIPNRNVRVIFTEGSGCYGLNGADSVSYDAAILSQAAGKPVRVQYSRRDEMTGADHYGPAYIINLKAGVDDKGQISAWDYEAWTLARGGRPNANNPGNIIAGALAGQPTPAVVPAAANPPTNYSNNSNAESSYGAGCVGGVCGGTGTIQTERILTRTVFSPFFTGPLRSPNRLQNTFANESFLDEIAAALGQDPVQYRVRHLTDNRLADCVTEAAKAAGWETRPSPKPGNAKTGIVSGRGISCVLYEGDNGYCALVAEVDVNQNDGSIVVTRFVAAMDSGPVSNPDGFRNQTEGGALQGMSRALYEEVAWNAQRLTTTDWRTYQIYRFGDFVPKFDTVLIDRKDVPQMGAGESSITLVAGAIANAVFDATGARLRRVPFTPERVLEALKARGA